MNSVSQATKRSGKLQNSVRPDDFGNRIIIYGRMGHLEFLSVVTTINLETLQRDKEGEPLTTLKTFRQPKGKDSINFTKEKYKTWPMVGMNTVIIKPGKISVGDQIILTPY